MKILFALSGLHEYSRGAEVAFTHIARALSIGGDEVTLVGGGPPRTGEPYRYIQVRRLRRELFTRWPHVPMFRDECGYEELSFAAGLARKVDTRAYDVTVTCGYPFTNWVLRWRGAGRSAHVFVTQNGDWPCQSMTSEFRWFGCDGLVCTNPDYFERNRARWHATLIPNGVDCDAFARGSDKRQELGVDDRACVVLMVSAPIASKRVDLGVRAVRELPGAFLLLAGAGPLQHEIDAMADEMLPGRYKRVSVRPEQMPDLYRSADVFLHLSRDESFGNVFLEALASGLPVVAPDLPRTRWIVGDEFLVADDSASSIAREIERARDAPAVLREGRRRRAETFSWSTIGGAYRQFLTEVVSRSNAQHASHLGAAR